MSLKIDGIRGAIRYGYDRVRESDVVHQVEDYRYRPPLLSGGGMAALFLSAMIVGAGGTWAAYSAGQKAVRAEFAGRVEGLQSRVSAKDQADAKHVAGEIARLRRLTIAEETTSTAHDADLLAMFDRVHKAQPAKTGKAATCGTPKKIMQALNKQALSK